LSGFEESFIKDKSREDEIDDGIMFGEKSKAKQKPTKSKK